jgi:hypothetical protein
MLWKLGSVTVGPMGVETVEQWIEREFKLSAIQTGDALSALLASAWTVKTMYARNGAPIVRRNAGCTRMKTGSVCALKWKASATLR